MGSGAGFSRNRENKAMSDLMETGVSGMGEREADVQSGVGDGVAEPRRAGESGAWEMQEIEAWPEAVKGAELLEALAAVVRRFVILPEWGAETVALWVLHSYGFEL